MVSGLRLHRTICDLLIGAVSLRNEAADRLERCPPIALLRHVPAHHVCDAVIHRHEEPAPPILLRVAPRRVRTPQLDIMVSSRGGRVIRRRRAPLWRLGRSEGDLADHRQRVEPPCPRTHPRPRFKSFSSSSPYPLFSRSSLASSSRIVNSPSFAGPGQLPGSRPRRLRLTGLQEHPPPFLQGGEPVPRADSTRSSPRSRRSTTSSAGHFGTFSRRCSPSASGPSRPFLSARFFANLLSREIR